jgi:hypothetical protein
MGQQFPLEYSSKLINAICNCMIFNVSGGKSDNTNLVFRCEIID